MLHAESGVREGTQHIHCYSFMFSYAKSFVFQPEYVKVNRQDSDQWDFTLPEGEDSQAFYFRRIFHFSVICAKLRSHAFWVMT